MNALDQYSQSIKELCASHKVSALHAIGSVLNNDFNINSDIDLIVDFAPLPVEEYADNYFDLKFALEDLFKRPVDLLEEKALKNPYFLKNIEDKKLLIYGY